jgi:hypothetical protein
MEHSAGPSVERSQAAPPPWLPIPLLRMEITEVMYYILHAPPALRHEAIVVFQRDSPCRGTSFEDDLIMFLYLVPWVWDDGDSDDGWGPANIAKMVESLLVTDFETILFEVTVGTNPAQSLALPLLQMIMEVRRVQRKAPVRMAEVRRRQRAHQPS